jgi:hypothetical protein
MRWTQTFIPTMKEDPADAEAPSHKLMLRAGLVRQLMAGAYTYLPLGYRSLRKAEAIVREEMDRAGAIEIRAPHQQLPADAADAVPDSDEVPERGTAAVRDCPDERVPDEGRVQLQLVG